MTGPIIVTRHDGWAELRIDREAKRNAMDRASRQGLLAPSRRCAARRGPSSSPAPAAASAPAWT